MNMDGPFKCASHCRRRRRRCRRRRRRCCRTVSISSLRRTAIGRLTEIEMGGGRKEEREEDS